MLTIKLEPVDGEILPLELHLEHSLVSLSKWESEHEKAFFSKDDKTEEESKSYIRYMVVGSDVPKDLHERLNSEHIMQIQEYINSKQSATWFREEPQGGGPREAITSELIYYWMIQFQIPFQPTEEWHISRLMNLVKICGIKQTKPKKMSRAEAAQKQRELNEQRRAALNTAG